MKPGSPEVRKSANNIYKIPASGGGQPAQVTKHTDGNVFWPSMSSDGKVIVYEDNFGIWKLDVASAAAPTKSSSTSRPTRRTTRREIETVTNEVDAFDISPSGRRAVISARGQILTIATDRGDITRIDPRQDGVAQRRAEVVGRRQVHRVRLRQVRAATRCGSRIRKGGRRRRSPTSTTRRGRSSGRPDSKLLLYTAADKKLYSYSRRRREDQRGLLERHRAHRIGVGLARQQVGRASRSRTARCARTSTSRRSPAAKSATSPTRA